MNGVLTTSKSKDLMTVGRSNFQLSFTELNTLLINENLQVESGVVGVKPTDVSMR